MFDQKLYWSNIFIGGQIMSEKNKEKNDVSAVSLNTRKNSYCNLIYNSEILKLTIFQKNPVCHENYNPKYNNSIEIKLTSLGKTLSRKELTTYILNMLNNKLNRVRKEAINFVREYNKMLVQIPEKVNGYEGI